MRTALYFAAACAGLTTISSLRANDVTVSFTPQASSSAGEPIITSIQLEGTNLVVLANVPSGFYSVTLEGCARLGVQGWTPKAIGRLKGSGGQVAFRLARGPGLEMLRLRASTVTGLPESFFQGQSSFAGQRVSETTMAPGVAGGGAFTTASTGIDAGPTAFGGPTALRTVAESDIWKLNGDTLYFFNQYRGLQVIEVSNPDAAVMTGTLALAAVGEQMYLLDDTHVILLAQDGCNWNGSSQMLVVEINQGKPQAIATLPIRGTITESRLVGSALYVSSSTYDAVVLTNTAMGTVWEAHTVISSFDLSQPAHPLLRSTAELPSSYDTVALATERFLFLAGSQMDNTKGSTWVPVIHIFDISAPDGSFSELATVKPRGRVKDKFKMNLSGDILTVVSEQNDGTTWVENISLANGASPQTLGSLQLTQGETLYATRFESNVLYAVTFHQIDPLWIVNLSDVLHPQIAGKLQVPGLSTYLYPWGDRLVAVGRDNTQGSHLTMSLFDVGNPASPALLNRVTPQGQYSYSEAEYDEKALAVLPDNGLILLPFSSWSATGGYSGTQLIDLGHDSLVLRGQIPQEMTTRRATVHRGRILSFSGQELLSVDAGDRDHPVVRSRTPLSWPVDRVFISGQSLLELDFGWSSAAGPQLRVTAASEPEGVLSRLALTNLPILGAAMRAEHLYVLQGRSAAINWQWDPQQQTNLVSTNAGLFSLTVLDLSQLPVLTVRGQTQTATLETFWGEWLALWPKPGVLVWKPTTSYGLPYGPLLGGGIVNLQGTGGIVSSGFVPAPIGGFWFWPWWGWGTSSQLVAFDVNDSSAPGLVSELNMDKIQGWSGASRAFPSEPLVYFSHREYESLVTGTNYYISTNMVTELTTNILSKTNILQIPQYVTTTNYQIVTNVTAMVDNRAKASGDWSRPTPVTGVLAAGYAHAILAGLDGDVSAWGANSFGQLGRGDSAPNGTMGEVDALGDVAGVAAGAFHNLAVKSDGTVWAWGAGFAGQLGAGPPVYATNQPPVPYSGSAFPVQALGVSNIISVSGGVGRSLALSSEGRVWTWGSDIPEPGCGTAVSESSFVPHLVEGLTDVRGITAGAAHYLALRTNGTVWAWGDNDFGQLGNGTTTSTCQPVQVSGLSNVVAVSGGWSHSLALDSTGTVWQWGRADLGQPTEVAKAIDTRPVALVGVAKPVAIAAGQNHNLALDSDGNVWSWGSNENGQLGRDTYIAAALPGWVGMLSNVVAIAAGAGFSLALRADGSLLAWGNNAQNQLGDGLRQNLTTLATQTNVSTVLTYLTVTNLTITTNIQARARALLVTNEYPIVTYLVRDYLDVVDYTFPHNPVVRSPVNIPGQLQGLSHGGAMLYTLSQRWDPAQGLSQSLDACAYDGVAAHLVDSLTLSNQWALSVLVNQTDILVGTPPADTNSSPQLQVWTLPDTGKFARIGSVTLGCTVEKLAAFGTLLAGQAGNQVQLVDISVPTTPKLVGSGAPDGCVGFDIDHADGALSSGLWLPLGVYGVDRVQVTGAPP